MNFKRFLLAAAFFLTLAFLPNKSEAAIQPCICPGPPNGQKMSAVINSFVADPNPTNPAGDTTLKWSAVGICNLILPTGESSRVSSTGTLPISVVTASEYKLSCRGIIFANGGTCPVCPVPTPDPNGNVVASTVIVNPATPALTANLTAMSPISAGSPSDMVATAGGTATGTLNYSFWWNCNDAASTYSAAISACGDPNTATVGAKFDNISENPKNISNIYNSAGTYTPKVLIERGSYSAESRTNITVTTPTLTAILSVNPSTVEATKETQLTATPGGTATGTVNYAFWWNCDNSSTDMVYLSQPFVCGDPDGATGNANGQKFTASLDNPKTVNHIYAAAGTYFAKVVIERGSASPAESRTTITVTNPTLTAALVSNPPAGSASANMPFEPELTASADGTATGTINYTFWWNCTDTSTTLSGLISACGNPAIDSNIGFKKDNEPAVSLSTIANYKTLGTYTAKVFVERGMAQPVIATAPIIVVPFGLPASVRVNVQVEWDERGKTQTINYDSVLENLK